jgi:hypothetical protein
VGECIFAVKAKIALDAYVAAESLYDVFKYFTSKMTRKLVRTGRGIDGESICFCVEIN